MDRLKYQKKLSWLAGFLSALGLVFPTLARAADQPRRQARKVRLLASAISGSQLVGGLLMTLDSSAKRVDVEFIFIEGAPGRSVTRLRRGAVCPGSRRPCHTE
jgi:hypothetical protein